MSKLPSEIRLQIVRKSTQDVWAIDELLDIIKKEVEAREATERIKADNTQQRGNQPRSQGHFPFCHWEGGKWPWHRAVRSAI